MAQTSVGFDGTVNEQQWASGLSGYLGNGYVVKDSSSLATTAVPAARKVSVSAGTAYGDGVATTLSTAEEVTMTTPVAGQWYLICLNRDWSTNTTSLKAVAGATTTTTAPAPADAPTSYPTIDIQPGITADQPIAWAWCNSANTTVVVADLRLYPVKDSYTSEVISPSKARLTSDSDVSLTSTEHALQIGPTSATNLRMDQNEIIVANNGVSASLYVNPGGETIVNELTTTGTINAVGSSINAGANLNATAGSLTALTGRITSTADVSITSTSHALQIGPTSATNMRFDQNEIMVVNNGATATLAIQADGGDVSLGNSASDTTIPGRIVATNYSWAQSAGTATTSASANVTVTFPGGGARFTVAPIVTVTSVGGTNAVCMPYVAASNVTNFTVSLYTTAGARVAQVIHWHAFQMTSTTAAG